VAQVAAVLVEVEHYQLEAHQAAMVAMGSQLLQRCATHDLQIRGNFKYRPNRANSCGVGWGFSVGSTCRNFPCPIGKK
jgi:hypothetical protein